MDGVSYASTIKKVYFTKDIVRTDTIVPHDKDTTSVEVINYMNSTMTIYQVCAPPTSALQLGTLT